MTLLNTSSFPIEKKKTLRAPTHISSQDISIVLPVRNNQSGITLFLREFLKTHSPALYPKEIIIVDNNSYPPITIPQEVRAEGLSISLLRCLRSGPAAARNMGIQNSHTEWIVFTDSDCIPSATFLTGYFDTIDGSVAYAGNVKAWGKDRWSQYYESQEILIPPSSYTNGTIYPEYIITANCLVWKSALEEIKGFNETIKIAAGEDIDVGFKLRKIGMLSYAAQSYVYHNFDDGLLGFIRRFVRYGRGNRLISKLYGFDLTPKVFNAKKASIFNWFLSRLQYICLWWGYRVEAKQ